MVSSTQANSSKGRGSSKVQARRTDSERRNSQFWDFQTRTETPLILITFKKKRQQKVICNKGALLAS